MKDSKIIKWNIKWLVISTILVLGVVLLTGFTTTQKDSWEQKYYEIKKERDYYKDASEKLLKNWKECEEKVVKLIGKSK
jgi:predicted negative regulator of RcsB-dependent stress response